MAGHEISRWFPRTSGSTRDDARPVLFQGARFEQAEFHRLPAIGADGSNFIAEVTLSPFHHSNEYGLLVVCRDGSEHQRLVSELRQAQKMESIGRLSGGIAHDLNNVLTVVKSFGDLAQEACEPDSVAHEQVGQMLSAAERAASLTRQLLAFARRQPLAPRVVTFNDILKDTTRMLRRIIGEAIDFRMVLTSVPWPVRVDPTQFQQVLLNLVVNARDAMTTGGQISIRTGNREVDDRDAREFGGSAAAGAYAMVSVSDTGAGIAPELRARIFEPFFTTKDEGKGTGLGLSTCQEIVRQCQGFIVVESQVGRGTTFRIYIPRVHATAEERVVPVTTAPSRGGCETVLVVEDDSQVRRVIAETLFRHGYRVLVAQHGIEAIRVVSDFAGPIDLLLTDVVMPKMGGPELASYLRPSMPDMRVLYLSGYCEEVVANELDGAREVVLEKPFSRGRLLDRVRALLDQRAHV